MPETPENYQRLENPIPGIGNVSRKKFFVILAGTTNGAHRSIVEEFKREGRIEVASPQECDYLLVFCPVASRVGTDISEAMDHIPAGKQAVLVVMHHTFNRSQVIAPSSRLVQNQNILLTVDCLFHDGKLLSCDLNNEMWNEVYSLLGVSQNSLCRTTSRCMRITAVQMILVTVLILVLVTLAMFCCFEILRILNVLNTNHHQN